MFYYWKIAKTLLPYLIGFAIGAVLIGYVEQQRIRVCQTTLKVSQNNEALCKDANATNQATIGSLTKEVKDTLSLCDTRLAVKEKTLANLKRISELKATKEGPDEKGKDNPGIDDPLLHCLNRMYPAVDSGEDGVPEATGSQSTP